MADEIKMTGSLGFAKGTSRASLSGSGVADGGDFYVHNIAVVGTVEEALFTGEMDPGTGAGEVSGWVMFKNLSTTNYVEIGPETGQYSFKLDKGEAIGPMPWYGDNIYAKANTNPVRLEYMFVEMA